MGVKCGRFVFVWHQDAGFGELVGVRAHQVARRVRGTAFVSNNNAVGLAIFDHDGVLVDSLEWHQAAWLELGRRAGLNGLTPEFIHQTFGMTNPMILRELLGDAVPVAELDRLGNFKEVCYRELARGKITLMKGVEPLLDELASAGVLLAIGSSGPRANLELTVASCGLDGRFAAIVSLEDITRGKPDPQVFNIAAERCGVNPARAVVFEDATVGIQAAKAAGMYAVGVGTTHPLASLKAAGADEVVESLDRFPTARLTSELGNQRPAR